MVKEKEFEFDKQELITDWITIENRIKAQIANAIWGKEEMYKMLLKNDEIVSEALKHYDKARKLISKK